MGKYEKNGRTVNVIKCILRVTHILFLLLIVFAIFAINFEITLDTTSLPYTIECGEECPTPKAYIKGKYFATNGVEINVNISAKCDTSNIGPHTNHYSVSFLGLSKDYTYNIFVVDSKAPIIELKTDDAKLTPIDGEYVEEGFSAYDEYDGDITENVSVFINGNIVTYFVQDSSGNCCSVDRKIRYDDQIAPIIELNGDAEIILSVGTEYVELGAVASDNIDGDITDRVIISDTLNTNKVGVYTLVYSVKDACGNETITYRTIEVVDYVIAPKNGKTIYLTFDDGPSKNTMQLLDVLDKYHVKGTFFVVGNGQYTDVIKDIVDGGHAIGIHTITHNYQKIYSSTSAFMEELYGMQKIISDLTGVETYLLRFPGGSSNTISKNYSEKIMTKLVYEVEQNGFYYFDWNVDSGDANVKTKTTEEVVENIINGIENPLNGVEKSGCAVVLQHDTKDFSVEAVESVIRWGLENGYSFDILSETSQTIHHGINN